MSLAAASLHLRLTAMMVAVAVAVALFALAVAGSMLATVEVQRSRQALVEEMESLARLIGSRSSAALVFGDAATARENLEALRGRQSVARVCLFDAGGRPLAVLPAGLACSPAAGLADEWRSVDGLDVRVQTPVRVEAGSPVVGAVRVDAASAPVWARLRDQAASAALALAVALGLATLLALVLQRFISRPLARIRNVAAAIDERGDLHLRAPDLGSNEFGSLARAFNRMLDTIERQNAGLAAREAYSRRLFHGSRIAQTVFDADLVCVDCNDAAMRLLGATDRTQVVGHRAVELGRSTQAGGRSAEAVLADARQALARDIAHRFEWQLRRPGGDVWDAQIDAIRVDVDGRSYFHCTLIDLSEQRAAEAARDAQRAAESANRAKSTFLSRMSHEMRTPLNAVLGFLQLLERDLEARLGSNDRRHIAIARDAGWHLQKLIDDALDVVRIESGRLPLSPAPLDTRRVIEASIAVCEPQAREAGIAIAPPPDAALHVTADEMRLQQVLINLLSNAVKYNRPGGRVWIEAGLEPGGAMARIVVSDTGIGIPAAQRAHLFEPFHRLGREIGSGVSGTGLGLALSRDLARQMGGDIVVDDAVGGGTRVVVTLPAAAVPAPEPAVSSPAATEPSADPNPAGEACGCVLYIEDNPVNQLLVEQCLLSTPGIRLLLADTGAEGLRLLADEAPDLVLLDMGLPDMTGLEWLARVADAEGRLPVPVIALSASAMLHEVSAARAAGVADYWTKPIDLRRFVGDLGTALAQARRSRRLAA